MLWRAYQRARRAWNTWRSDSYEEFFLRQQRLDDRARGKPPEHLVGDPDQFHAHAHWQRDYLVDKRGLQPDHDLLDYGCGPLRGGEPLIRYLEPGRYTGVDISQASIQAGARRIAEHGLKDKRPMLVANRGLDVHAYERFDRTWSNSVLTHLPPSHLDRFAEVLTRATRPGGRIIVTFFHTDPDETEAKDAGAKVEASIHGTGWRYPGVAVRTAFERHGARYVGTATDVGHPQDQAVILLRKPGVGHHR